MARCRLFYHVTWSTKNRQSLITDANRNIIFKSIISKATELGATIIAINGVEDHIHILVSASPNLAPCVLIGQMKGVSSHLIRHLGWSEFKWQKEYSIIAVPELEIPIVARYILNQQAHHPQRNLQ